MYILLAKDHTVAEIIPDEDPVFPGVRVEDRYAPDFVRKLLFVPDGTEAGQNWVYNPESGAFSPPPEPAPPDPDEEEPSPDGTAAPSLRERVETLEIETTALAKAVERGLAL